MPSKSWRFTQQAEANAAKPAQYRWDAGLLVPRTLKPARRTQAPYGSNSIDDLIEARHQARQEKAAGARVKIYIVHADNPSLVKIGQTQTDIEQRLRALQTANAHPLTVLRLIPETSECIGLESAFHRYFRHWHVRGEWFRFHPVMLTIEPSEVMEAQTPLLRPAKRRATFPAPARRRAGPGFTLYNALVQASADGLI